MGSNRSQRKCEKLTDSRFGLKVQRFRGSMVWEWIRVSSKYCDGCPTRDLLGAHAAAVNMRIPPWQLMPHLSAWHQRTASTRTVIGFYVLLLVVNSDRTLADQRPESPNTPCEKLLVETMENSSIVAGVCSIEA